MTPSHRIRSRALALGFARVGIARVTPLEAAAHYERWIAHGRHGDMRWMASAKHRERRADPGNILRGVQSVVSVALAHDPARDPARDARLGRIARYAAGEDYHRVMRDRLRVLARFVERDALPGARALWYADTGAILERAWAERAGLGWIGKHAGLISPQAGSYLLLGELYVNAALDADAPLAREHCGRCTRCLDVCPTQAIVAPYQVDARRCISYLTIEQRGPIPRELRPAVGEWVFGCDLCQEACPWNRFAPPAHEARLRARALEGWTLERFLALDDAAFGELFADSPIRRATRDGFVRNVCVALGNRADPASAAALAHALAHDRAPLVRAHAAWALGRIAARAPESRAGIVAALAAALGDADACVREEAAAAWRDVEPTAAQASGAPSTHASPPPA